MVNQNNRKIQNTQNIRNTQNNQNTQNQYNMMKNYTTILFFCLFLCLSSCQQISESDRLIDMPAQAITSKPMTHLLMDFSAFRCVNCPEAAELASRLKTRYDTSLVVVTMHAPMCPLTQGLYDYTCAAADAYFTQLGGEVTTPLPMGNIDGVSYGDYLIDRSVWETALTERLRDTAVVNIDMSVNYDALTRSAHVMTTLKDYDGAETKATNILLWLVEDGVIGPQMMPDNTTNMQYVHNHLLREAMNGTWGVTQTLPSQTTYSMEYDLPSVYDATHCTVVAVVVDAENKRVYAVAQSPYLLEDSEEESVLSVEVSEYGEIEAEGMSVTLTEPTLDPLTGKQVFGVEGFVIADADELIVEIGRSEVGIEDEFCCGSVCTVGNAQTAETKRFALSDGFSNWYTHYTPRPDSDVTITYTFRAGQASAVLTVRYVNKE